MHVRGIGLLAIVALLALGASASAQVLGRVDLATVRVTAVPGPPSGDFWDGSIIGRLPGLAGAIIKNTSAPSIRTSRSASDRAGHAGWSASTRS